MAESSKIIVFNFGYLPKTGIIKLKGVTGGWVTNKFGACVVDNTKANRKLIEASHLQYWVPPEELSAEELQLNHWYRYKQQKEIEEMSEIKEMKRTEGMKNV